MRLSQFSYDLDQKQIAQKPLPKRSASRLLVLNKTTISHAQFPDILKRLKKDDILVVNDSKVFPAKLEASKLTGGKVSILLTKMINPRLWECMVQGKNTVSKTIRVGSMTARIGKNKDDAFTIEFSKIPVLEKIGKAPLPPYIKKEASLKRYNTVYAKNKGSIAAPTAGLHFTPELLAMIKKKGTIIAPITLHVGLGTFLPVKEDDISKHRMHEENYTISKKTASILNHRKGDIFVVGTTAIRALESATDEKGKVIAKTGTTNIFITPGYHWKLPYKGLITNFHLPRSTLLMLVFTFSSRENILKAYQEAIKKKYRFFSFGDAMLILK